MEGKIKQDRKPKFAQLKPEIEAAEAAGNWAKALELLAPIVADDAGLWPVGAHVRLAQAYEKLDRRDDSEAQFARLRRVFPDHVAGWRGGARQAQVKKDWPTAVALWQHCMTHFPAEQEESWWIGLANALRRQPRISEALAAYATLRDRWPGNPQGWAGPAQIAGDAGRWTKAARLWVACANHFGDKLNPALSNSVVTALIRAGRHGQAAEEIERLRQRDAASGRWMALRLELLLAQGDLRAAAAEIAGFTAHPAFLANFTTDDLVPIALEMGYSVAEAQDWLGGLVDIEGPLQQAADHNWTKPTADLDPQAAIDDHEARMYRNWVTDYKRTLRAFLARRTCVHFIRFVKTAVAFLPRRKIEILLALADKRFPNARIRRQLYSLLHGDTEVVSDPYADFDPVWRKSIPRPMNAITAQIAGRPWRRLVCAVMVCDEDEMLPVFLHHHKALGVESFIVIDNNSTRPPQTVLGDMPGFEITFVNAPFSFTESGCGMSWINEVLAANICDWVLFADCDELMIYPGSDTTPLAALLDHLDARGDTAVKGLMVDLYDPAYLNDGRTSSILAEHNLFCASQDLAGDLRLPGHGVFNRRRPPGVISPSPNKTPLVKGSAGVRYTGNHWTTPCKASETTVVLWHYKIFRDRDLVGMAVEEVMNHPRIRDRQLDQFNRHLTVARMVVDTSFDHPFHLEMSPERLLRLGYMEADAGWRAMVGHRLPPDMKAPALRLRPGLTYAGKFGTYNYPFMDAHLAEVLAHVRMMAEAGQRQALRLMLNAQMARLGRREAALGLLLVAAVALNREAAAARLLHATRAAILDAGEASCISAICDVADALADQPDMAMTLLNALAGVHAPDPRIAERRCAQLGTARKFGQAIDAMDGINPGDTERTLRPFLEAAAFAGDWDLYRHRLDGILNHPDLSPSTTLLRGVAMCPYPDWRAAALDGLLTRTEGQVEAYDRRATAAYLAVLHLCGRKDALAAALVHFADRLPPLVATYFARLVAAEAGAAPPNRVWALGLSKTGTSSLHEFCQRLGLLSAHWTNPYLGTLLDRADCEIFDVVSDTPVPWLARTEGLPAGRLAIGTRRDFDGWARSFYTHFSRDLAAPDPSFDDLRRQVEGNVLVPFGAPYMQLHMELYFRFASLREAYDYHQDWTDGLAKAGTPVLDLVLETPDADKARLVGSFLGRDGKLPKYPHSNKAKPQFDPEQV